MTLFDIYLEALKSALLRDDEDAFRKLALAYIRSQVTAQLIKLLDDEQESKESK